MSAESSQQRPDDLSFLDELVNPEWATISGAPLNPPEENLWSAFNFDLPAKEQQLFDSFSTYPDISSIFPPLPVGESASIPTVDIFSSAPSTLPHPIVAEPALATFSVSSGSPADSTSPNQSASISADPDDGSMGAQTDSDSDADSIDEEEFAPVRRPAPGKGRAGGGARGKRAATKPKPYPRISDVVRDAPQKGKSIDARRASASTELKGSIRTADAEDDDWRPTLEEYQRMSSKEKRQLRNKISARNFRVRRKEYITTLEGEVATRDKQIEDYREELSTTKNENSLLKQEIERLRKAILEGRGDNLFEKAAQGATNILSSANTKPTRSTRAKVNRNKDLPSTGSTRGFWGGAIGAGATPVHTTLVPDFDVISSLSGKPKMPAPLQENMNPHLNSKFLGADVSSNQPIPNSLPGFDGFVDTNSFTYKTLENYRMQLWQKMAREAGAAQAAKEKALSDSPSSSSSSSLSWPSSNLSWANASVQPHYFTTPKTVAKVEEKGAMPLQAIQATAATNAAQGIIGKLSGAFWDAFSGQKPTKANASGASIDVDKVRRVLEGKAVLRVVDVDGGMGALEESLKNVSLNSASDRKAPALKRSATLAEPLEDAFKSMALSKKTAAVDCTSVIGIFQQPIRAGHGPAPIAPKSHVGRAVVAQH